MVAVEQIHHDVPFVLIINTIHVLQAHIPIGETMEEDLKRRDENDEEDDHEAFKWQRGAETVDAHEGTDDPS